MSGRYFFRSSISTVFVVFTVSTVSTVSTISTVLLAHLRVDFRAFFKACSKHVQCMSLNGSFSKATGNFECKYCARKFVTKCHAVFVCGTKLYSQRRRQIPHFTTSGFCCLVRLRGCENRHQSTGSCLSSNE